MKGERSFLGTTVKRVALISALAAFVASTATVIVFFFSFREELITNAVRRIVEQTVGYRVSLVGIRPVSLNAVSVDDIDLVLGSTTISSGPTVLGFRLGISPLVSVRKVSMEHPSISLDLSKEGTGNGADIINRLMRMDIDIAGGDLAIIEKGKRYRLVGLDMSYTHGLFGKKLSLSGSARTEGSADGAILGGPFWVQMRVTGDYPKITARGTITTRRSGWRIDNYLFSWGQLDARVSLDEVGLEATDARVTDFSLVEEKVGLKLDGISGTGAMKNENNGPFTLRDVRLSAPRLGDVSLDLIVNEDGRWKVGASSDSLTLSSESVRRLGHFVPDFFYGWGAKGRVRGALTMGTVDTEDGSIAGNLDATLIDAGFSSPDSLYLGEGVSGNVVLRFRDDVKGGFSFEANAVAHDFQLLLADFFMNFKDTRISASLEGTLVNPGEVKDLDCELAIPNVLSSRVAGDIDYSGAKTRVNLTCAARALDLGKAFDLFLREFFRNRAPSLYTGQMMGSLSFRGAIAGDLSAPKVSGYAAIEGASIDLPDIGTKIEGLEAAVPFSVDLSSSVLGDTSPRFEPRDFGTIAFSRAVVGGVEIGETAFSPALVNNALSFKDEVRLPISGGSIKVGGFAAKDIFNENRTVSLSLDIEGVDIARMFPKERAVNLEGGLSGNLSEVRVADKKLFTSGGLTATIFGGKVTIGNIWGENVFDAGRRLGCDVAFSDLDLGMLTQTIDVGKVTGIAEGRIAGLTFSYGEPERFVFDFSTVEKRGARKRVSVDFVDKLTILGSGSSLLSGVLGGAVKRFIHEYNYSKIGIHLELKDDYFTLRGTIHEGNKEYLIKRSGLTGIDVINQNPDNKIGFKDMMKRLERINVKNTSDIRIETR